MAKGKAGKDETQIRISREHTSDKHGDHHDVSTRSDGDKGWTKTDHIPAEKTVDVPIKK